MNNQKTPHFSSRVLSRLATESRSGIVEDEILYLRQRVRDLEQDQSAMNGEIGAIELEIQEMDDQISVEQGLLAQDIRETQEISVESLESEQKAEQALFDAEDTERRLLTAIAALQREVDAFKQQERACAAVLSENQSLQLRNEALAKQIRLYIEELEEPEK